jgi:hypothetical protein
MSGKEKKTVLKVFWPFTFMVVANCLLAAAGFITGNFYVAVLFTLITLFVSYPVYNPNIKIVFIGSKGYTDYLKKDGEKFIQNYKNIKDEPGIFNYTDVGFSISREEKAEHYTWDSINTMMAYKRDNVTTDCICLILYFNDDRQLEMNEELKGWCMFNKRIKEKFPQINKQWDLEIASPAFKTNLTLVYDRAGRTLEEVMRQDPVH